MLARLTPAAHISIAPSIPSWVLADREESDVRVPDEKLRNCSLFLGWKTEVGFLVEGTGFLVTLEEEGIAFPYLLTAAHILWPRRRYGDTPHAKMSIRINNENREPSVIDTSINEWLFHSDKNIDLCAYPFDIKKHSLNDELEISRVDLSSMAISDEKIASGVLGLGDEVIIIGAFTGRIGHKKNIPIVRIGNIAAMAEEPVDFGSPRHPAYPNRNEIIGGN